MGWSRHLALKSCDASLWRSATQGAYAKGIVVLAASYCRTHRFSVSGRQGPQNCRSADNAFSVVSGDPARLWFRNRQRQAAAILLGLGGGHDHNAFSLVV